MAVYVFAHKLFNVLLITDNRAEKIAKKHLQRCSVSKWVQLYLVHTWELFSYTALKTFQSISSASVRKPLQNLDNLKITNLSPYRMHLLLLVISMMLMDMEAWFIAFLFHSCHLGVQIFIISLYMFTLD